MKSLLIPFTHHAFHVLSVRLKFYQNVIPEATTFVCVHLATVCTFVYL